MKTLYKNNKLLIPKLNLNITFNTHYFKDIKNFKLLHHLKFFFIKHQTRTSLHPECEGGEGRKGLRLSNEAAALKQSSGSRQKQKLRDSRARERNKKIISRSNEDNRTIIGIRLKLLENS